MIGNSAARERLKELVKRGKVAHAYLFAGPVGVGKATAALEFARALVCGCEKCTTCKQILSGTCPAVMTLRPPEDRQGIPIEAVRDMIRSLSLKADSWRVVIIDGAETLSEEAMNALLKTLEEPPDRVVMILIAASAGQLLPTILSRCHVVLFYPLTDEELRMALADLKLSDEDFLLLRDLCGGSPGTARKLAEDLPALKADVESILTSVRSGALGALVDSVSKSKEPRERARFVLSVLLAEQRRALLHGDAAAVERIEALLRSRAFIDMNANIGLAIQDALLSVSP